MPNCSVLGCGIKKSKDRPNISLHRLPKNNPKKKKWLDAIGVENLKSYTESIFVCSQHFKESCFIRTLSNIIVLRDDALPTRIFLSDPVQQSTGSDGSATCTTEPAGGMVEVKEELPEFIEIEIQDPLHQTDQESLLQTDIEPHTSAVPEVKIEVENDYRAMFFKLQEEVTALRIANQSLSEENQILTERSQKLAKEVDTLLETNSNLSKEIKYRNKEHDIFTERIRELTNQNQCFAEKIKRLTEKCNEEFQSEDTLSNKSDEMQTIEDRMKRFQAVVEENKCLNEERDSLVKRNEEMAETARIAVEDNKRLKHKIKMVLRRKRRLKNCTAQGEEMESKRKREQDKN